jgi:hypothetical protein
MAAATEIIKMQTEEASKATTTLDEEDLKAIQTEMGSSVTTANYKATDRKNEKEESVNTNLAVMCKAGYIGQNCL